MKTDTRSMFHLLTFFTLLILCFSVFPTSPGWAASNRFAWAKRLGGLNHDYVFDIAVDTSGNVYTTGRFQGTSDYDPGPGTYNLNSTVGSNDIFISKLDSNGNFAWARSLGGGIFDNGYSIAADPSGNVYTTGTFEGTADFDPGSGTANRTSAGGDDIFISKLDSNGNFVWARSMGGMNFDSGYSVALDANGNGYTTGRFSDTVDFDPGPGMYSLTSAGGDDIFIVKLNSNGNFVWARSMGGGANFDNGKSLAVDASGNVYTTGMFQGAVDFDPGSGNYNLTSAAGTADIFISKLDSNGNFVWARSLGGVNFDTGTSLAVDTSGNVYTTGTFLGTADFDPGSGTSNLISGQSDDIFISKLDSNGNFIWARSMGGEYFDQSLSLDIDTSGNVYTTGHFTDSADFDPGPEAYNLTTAVGGDSDIFISKLDSNGSFVWARGMGSGLFDSGYGLALDPSGNVHTTGIFRGTVDFDPGAGIANLTTVGGLDIFVHKIQEGAFFADVPLGYWALDFVERLYTAGITGGCATSPLRYCPEGTVTRAQMAVFLERGIHGSTYNPPAVGGSTGFGDVPTTYWAAAWIKQLAAEGITSGCGSGNYCPEGVVTRAQMAVFLLRAKHGSAYVPPAIGSGTGFSDVSPSYWAAAWIKQLVAEGITSGCGMGTYCPESPVTRAQMAVFLVRTFNLP